MITWISPSSALLHNLDLWLAAVVLYFLQQSSLQEKRFFLRRLLHEGERWMAASSGPSLRQKGFSLNTSTLFDLRHITSPLKDLIGEAYLLALYSSGENFQRVLGEDLQVFMMVLRSLEGAYAFILQALRSFALIATLICVLSWIGEAHTYNFRTMIGSLLVVQLLYVALAQKRLISFVREDVGHLALNRSHAYARSHPNGLAQKMRELLLHKRELKRQLQGFWHQARQSLPSSLFTHTAKKMPLTPKQDSQNAAFTSGPRTIRDFHHAADHHPLFTLISLQWLKECRMRQDVALLQIFGGALSMILFLRDNFSHIFLP